MDKSNLLLGIWRCEVESVKSENGMPLCQVRVIGLWDAVKTEQLPFAEYMLPVGARANSGDYTPCKKGDIVWCQFDMGDSRYPIIIGSAYSYSNSNLNKPLLPPETYDGGVSYAHKRTSKQPPAKVSGKGLDRVSTQFNFSIERTIGGGLRATHRKTGTAIEITEDGQIVLHCEKDSFESSVNKTNEAQLTIKTTAGKLIDVQSGGDIKLKAGSNVSIEAGQNATIKAGMSCKVQASMSCDVKAMAVNLSASSISLGAPSISMGGGASSFMALPPSQPDTLATPIGENTPSTLKTSDTLDINSSHIPLDKHDIIPIHDISNTPIELKSGGAGGVNISTYGAVNINSHSSLSISSSGGCKISSSGSCEIKASQCSIDAQKVSLAGGAAGVVTAMTPCHYNGAPHQGSSKVFAGI